MQSFCHNRVLITGTPEDLQALRAHVMGPNPLKSTSWFDLHEFEKEQYGNDYYRFVEERHAASDLVFSLGAIIPHPQTIIGNLPDDNEFSHVINERQPWYRWNIEHWGTPWEVAEDVDVREISDIEIEYIFRTVATPPTKVFHELLRLFPEVTICHTFVIWGRCLAGLYVWKKSQLVTEETCNFEWCEITELWEDPDIFWPRYTLTDFKF